VQLIIFSPIGVKIGSFYMLDEFPRRCSNMSGILAKTPMNPSYPTDPARVSSPSMADPSQIPANAYTPSVPMSVYRELAAELQATKAMADALNNQNQSLAKQNQILRQEIHQVVQAALQLGQYAGVAYPAVAHEEPSFPTTYPANGSNSYPSTHPVESANLFSAAAPVNPAQQRTGHSIPAQPGVKKLDSKERGSNLSGLSFVPKFFTEQMGEKQRHGFGPESSKEMSSLWLITSIMLIILTAFGAGFLIMRPLLSDR
jgi:hypothetical protein